MRGAITIEPEWLVEIAPHYYKESDIKKEKQKMPKQIGQA